MKSLIRLVGTRLTSDRADARVGQIVCFAGAIALFVIATLRLCALRLPEGQLLIGLLAALACTLLLMLIGLLLPLAVRPGPRDATGGDHRGG